MLFRSRCLERMVADGALRERITAQGREFVTQSFDWERATERLEEILASY